MNTAEWIDLLCKASNDDSDLLSGLFQLCFKSAATAELDTLNEICLNLPVDKVDSLFIIGLLRTSFSFRMHLVGWFALRNKYKQYCIDNNVEYKYILRGLLDDTVVCKPRLIKLHPSLLEKE